MKYIVLLLCLFGVVFSGAMIFNTSNYCEFIGNYWTNNISYPHVYGIDGIYYYVRSDVAGGYFSSNTIYVTVSNTTATFAICAQNSRQIDIYYNMSILPIGNYTIFVDFKSSTDTLYNITKNRTDKYYISNNNGATWTEYPITQKLFLSVSESIGTSFDCRPTIYFNISTPFNYSYNNVSFYVNNVILVDLLDTNKKYNKILALQSGTSFATYNSSNYFQTQSTTQWNNQRCNMTFLFSSKVLTPEILITPSLFGASFYKPYNPSTLITSAPNNTPFFFKDEYFKQWYYVPAIPCYSTDVITTNVYAINDVDKCYINDTLVSQSSQYQEFGQRINKIGIIYQNNNISCIYQNTTSPYYIECTMNDTMNIGNGWRMYLKEELHNQSVDYCINESTSKHVSLRCNIDRNKKYTLTVFVNVDNKYYPLKYFLYSGGSAYPSLTLGNFTYLIAVILIIAGLLLFSHTPEYAIMSFGFAMLFVVFMGLITYFNVFVPVLLIIILLLLVLYRKF